MHKSIVNNLINKFTVIYCCGAFKIMKFLLNYLIYNFSLRELSLTIQYFVLLPISRVLYTQKESQKNQTFLNISFVKSRKKNVLLSFLIIYIRCANSRTSSLKSADHVCTDTTLKQRTFNDRFTDE